MEEHLFFSKRPEIPPAAKSGGLDAAGNPSYASPVVEVWRVELENAVASSVSGSGGTDPQVDDWTPATPDPGDSGDLSL